MASCVRCSELWYEDGNVVFDAQGTLFRVYRGILAANSSVFADMFTFPQPPANTDSYEGCPLIATSDDPEEFKFFLKAIHDASFYVHDVPTPYPVVFAILRLASKYDVQYLRARAIYQLSHDYPATFTEFDALEEGAPGVINGDVDMHALADLLRESDVLFVLPCVLFHICSDAPSMEYLLDCSLGPANKRACVLGLHALKTRRLHLMGEPRVSVAEGCSNPTLCSILMPVIWKATVNSWNSAFFSLSVDPSWYIMSNLCEPCGRECAEYARAEDEATWEALPNIFGLPPWDELRATADRLS